MISELSEKIAYSLYLKDEKKENELEVIQYGLELFLSTIIHFTIIVCLSLILHCFIETMIFFLFFSSLRFIAGGYHATSHLKCLSFYAGICFVTIFSMRFLGRTSYVSLLIIGLCAVSTILIFIFSPSEAKQKPLCTDEYRKYKKISRWMILAESFFIIFGYIIFANSAPYLLIATGAIFTESLTLIKMKHGGIRNEEYV